MPCWRNGSVHLLVVEQLQQGRAASADPAVVLNADHQPMVTRQVHDRGVPGLDPARVDDGDADALVGEPRGHLDRHRGHRADADDEHVAGAVAHQHVHAAGLVDGLDVVAAAGPWGCAATVGASSTATASRSSSRDPGAVARRAQPQARDDLEDRHVPHAVVAGAVVTGHAGAVEHERHAARCSATSISTWSKARLRKVA